MQITGMLVMKNGEPVRDEALLHHIFMLSTVDAYMHINLNETEPLPDEAVQEIDKYFDSDYLRWGVFWEQEIIGQLFKTDVDRYATALRLMLAEDSTEMEDAQQMQAQMELFANGTIRAQEAAERIAQFTRYNNNKFFRETLSVQLQGFLDKWRGWQDSGKNLGWRGGPLGGYDLEIEGIRVKGQVGLDLLKLGTRFYQLQAKSAMRVEMLQSLRDYAVAHPQEVQLEPALLEAMDQVILEADSVGFTIAETIVEFVREKAVNSILDTTKDKLAKEWGHFAFKRWGHRIVGHRMAGAVSGIFAGYAISNFAFDLDAVNANTYNARYTQLIHDQLAQSAYNIRTSVNQSSLYADEALVVPYQATYVFSKLAEIEFYTALAERSQAVWTLRPIIDFFSGGRMTQGIELARDYAQLTATHLYPYWVTPPLIDRAIELAVSRKIVSGSFHTSTVLVIDVSGSMDEQDSSGVSKLTAAKRAALQLIQQLVYLII